MMAPDSNPFQQCPMPFQQQSHVHMGHGGGGPHMHQLIDKMFLSTWGSQPEWKHDAARLSLPHGQIAFTTDSYVVSPLFFPGGDIGSMSVYGTVNDLAMSGAKPLYLSLSFILEEGLPLETLWKVVQSIRAAADRANVQIVTGDTKAVERGKADGLYVNTAGVGVVEHALMISSDSVRPGDAIIVSGDIGRHAIAVLLQREGLEFETSLESDLAPVWPQVQKLLQANLNLHCLRDLTRGGLAAAMHEISQASQLSIQLSHEIPVTQPVRGACEVLGLDPLYLANEGRFVLFIEPSLSAEALQILNAASTMAEGPPKACQIGVVENPTGCSPLVSQRTATGGNRLIMPRSLAQMPRIC